MKTKQSTRFLLSIALLSTCFCRPALCQDDYASFNIDNDMGLSQSNVKCITQDSYGFLWFGTKNGLNRFDGRNMVQKECYDQRLHCGNQNISALHEDQNRMLWIGTDVGVYIYDQQSESMTFFEQTTDDGKGIRNWIACITEDRLGDIWIVSPPEGVFRYHDGKLDAYFSEPVYRNAPSWISVSENGDVWLSTWYRGIFRFNRQEDAFSPLEKDINGLPLTRLEINMVCPWRENLLLPIQTGQLFCYNVKTRQLSDITPASCRNGIIRTANIHRDQAWIGTYEGMHVLDERFREVAHLRHDRSDASSLSDNIIYCSYEDSEQGVWIGTIFGGVCYLPQRSMVFHALTPIRRSAMPSERVREMASDGEGTLWVGTEDAGFFSLDTGKGVVRRHASPFSNDITLAVAAHGGRVLLSYFKEGLEVVERDGTSSTYTLSDMGLEGKSAYALSFSREGELWIGTDGGLYRSRDGFTDFVCVMDDIWAFDVLEALDGSFWIATMGNGVYHYLPQCDSIVNYRNQTGMEGTVGSNSVSSITQDSRGRLWFSTDRGGLCLYRPETDDFRCFTTADGLPDNVVYKVQEDRKGHLWFGTNHGLVQFDPEKGRSRVFTTSDGIPGNEFNYKSAVMERDGCLYMGTTEGITWFNPSEERTPVQQPPIYLTRMSLFGHEVRAGEEGSPLTKSILLTESVTLPYNKANMSFDVALPDYANRLADEFEYRLEPADREWTRSGSNWSIAYANLSPGTYCLHVRAQTSLEGSAPYSSCRLNIRILPPWWWSRIAITLYLMAFAGALWVWLRWYRSRKNRQLAEQTHLFEVEKEKELYQSKVNFFTQIAHEIRTPLTLITAPLEVLRQRLTANASLSAASTGSATEAAAAPVQEDRELQTISRNVDRLMTLATQLLDFQRLAGQEMSLTMEEVNVSALVRETVVRFEDAFRYRGKRMELVESDEDIVTVVDREAITKILSNLFNNALKYCDQATVVELTHDSREFKLRVTSDGKRIPNERNEEIFRPFVQLETPDRISGGIGIGLGMARSLALLHHGTLALDLHHEQNSFVLAIPLAARQPQEARAEAASESRTEDAETDTARTEPAAIRYTLLVVEDDEEILMLLHDQLKEQYHVLTAHNGAEALDVLGKHDVDLVITDLMMPVMDGYSLCEHIKSDAEHNQTPVVVLTALGDIDNKLKSLQCGAEAFIEKPFSVSYLLSQVATILDNRYRERVAFSKRPYIPENSCRTDREDKELVDRIIAITEQNLRDGDFNVGNLASELCMSRSSLLRRIRTLFNVSPVELIRLIRLKHAAELIQDGRYRLGEISTMVGFNSPSYFSKLFARQFGMTPKEFEKQVEQKRTKVGAESHLDITEMIRNMSREEEIAHE